MRSYFGNAIFPGDFVDTGIVGETLDRLIPSSIMGAIILRIIPTLINYDYLISIT